MEYYDWNLNASKTNVETLFGKPAEEIENVKEYSESVANLMNEGDDFNSINSFANDFYFR